ncbi:MAG: DUF4493 domain-containing protein [Parabacteroides sp.]|nr:DUF4493 domain-containing protein [Parabacteroides sp.]
MKEYQLRQGLGKTIAFSLCVWASVAGFFSCDSDRLNSGGSTGMLSLNLAADTTNIKGGAISTKAGNTLADFEDVDEYTVQVLQESDTLKSALYKDFPEQLEIKEGSYTLRASKGGNLPAAFDNPYFEGSTDFVIKKDMKTPLEVTCTMANARIYTEYTEDFLKAYSDYSVSLKTSYMDGAFTIAKDETRGAYLQVAKEGTPLSIAISLMRENWEEPKVYSVTNPAITLNPKESVTLKFATDGKTGDGLNLSVVLDDEMIETDLVGSIPGFMWKPFEDLKIEAIGFVNNDVVSMSVTEGYKNPTCMVRASVPGRIKDCLVGRYEEGQDTVWLNIATPEGLNIAETEWGLHVNTSPIAGAKGVELDLKTAFNSLFATEKEKTHSFSVYVNDALNVMHTSDKVTASVKLAKAEEPEVIPFELTVLPEHSMEKDTSIYVMAEAGVESLNLEILRDVALVGPYDLLKQTELKGISYDPKARKVIFNRAYTSALTLKENGGSSIYKYKLTVRDKLGKEKQEISTFNVVLPEYTIIVPEGDVWAKRASFKMNEEVPYAVKYQIKDGESWIDVKGDTIKGLTPGKEYQARALVNGKWPTEGVDFMTEEALRVPNAGFEEWNSNKTDKNGNAITKNLKYVYWNKWFPWALNDESSYGWNTLNQKTTQDGAAPTVVLVPMPPYVGCCYVANSGTIPTEDRYSGDKATLIRTVGWGSGSSAPGGVGLIFDGVIKRFDPGYLYLGSYTETPESSWSGLPFDSRPSAVTFYCKYKRAKGKSQSSDKYVAKVIVEHRDGDSVIKLGEGSLPEGGDSDISSYTYKKIDISYTNTILKATHLYIMFKSGTVAEYDYFSVPSNNNLSNGEYIGSQLYIDDVELIYE